MKSFEPLKLPLNGAHLIEASAGTGKTYALASLFMRLVVEQGISVDRILVVTYTKAATEELKTRIRQRLVSAKRSWHQNTTGDPLLVELRRRAPSADQGLQRIQDALIEFDRASIFTIHGFCQRMLQYFAFETGHLFHSELVQDDSPLVQETAQDFWRRHISRAPKELALEAITTLGGPNQLAKTLKLCRFPNIAVFPNDRKPALRAIRPWREIAEKVLKQWLLVREKVKELLQHDGLNGRIYGVCKQKKGQVSTSPRQTKIDAICNAMDQWQGEYPLFKQFELLSSHRLKLATKKGKETPAHPFFDLCEQALACHDDLKEQLGAYLRYLKVRLYHTARWRMEQKKERHNVLFFDDLLLLVHRALKGSHGNSLTEAIRSQYPVALVDEFQDTDQLQYEIFIKLFAGEHSLLAMIGDPKQAIYSFRGADLFSYLRAAKSAQTSSTLTRNWRSTPGLIEAVNTLFSNHTQPFGFRKIGFDRAVPAHDDQDDPSPAMRLWYLPTDDQDVPKGGLGTAVAVTRIAEAVTREVVALLGHLERAYHPEDIAILVRTHHQAQIVKQALTQKKVPAVLHSAGRIFDTEEAEQMERVIAAVASPSDMALVRVALTGPLLGWDAAGLLASLDKESPHWQTQWEAFLAYHQIWMQHGFYAMFRRLMIREGVKQRVLGHDEGERCLTNLLHLAELLHQAEATYGYGPDGLVKWLAFQRRSQEIGSDEQQLRLESDARAVRIITMHKSKGLQFEVVFCPYTWAGTKDNVNAAVFHHPENHDQITLALGPQIPKAYRIQAQKEDLAENLRMLYVALTRARQRCYWVWGRIKGAEISAPAYLLHGQGVNLDEEGWAETLKDTMANMQPDQWMQDLKKVTHRSNGSIRMDPLPASDFQNHTPTAAKSAPLSYRISTRGFKHSWRIASFSSMTADHHHQSDEHLNRDMDSIIDAHMVASKRGKALLTFPKGAQAGLFFHDVLENWDHTAIIGSGCDALVAAKLQQHGYEPEWRGAVCDLLATLAQAPLASKFNRFSLNQVRVDDRINEMGFYFPLKSVGATQIKALFGKFAPGLENRQMVESMGRLHFAPTQGLMKGFIDMVIHHSGRYYLVDWKSNYLGARDGDYAHGKLEVAMNESYYYWQYHIYAVALDQLLRQRLADYDYNRHFGGVFYIFLRGLAPTLDDATGIYYDLPDANLMTSLNRLLIAEQ